MIRLDTTIKKFTNVLHISDIHIRLTQRHQEYLEIFDKLYTDIDKTPDTTIIVVAGDIFHNKSDLSPESVKIATELFKNLADRRPTILIAGNHDATLANKNRLDSLSPVVSALNHSQLYYLRDSGVYIIGDILFNNYSVFDAPDQYLKFKDIPSIYRNEVNYTIALFHGPVNNAITDVGYTVSSRTAISEIFDGHQMVMLGDIHRHQVLQQYDYSNDKPVVVYPGSCIQQDHGEELKGHGYVYWNLKDKSFKHIELPNDYGFFTVEVNKGILSTDILSIPKKAKLRIKCVESVQAEVKTVLSEIRKSSEITDVSYIRVDVNTSTNNIIDTTNFNLKNLSDVDYQNSLIKEFISNKKLTVSNETLEQIYALNKELNNALKKEYTPKNIRWKPKIFEFDNMFNYGEGNSIDFSKMHGNMGLFANNASGKSSILSALSFCLFDKCDRTFKAVNILNSQKMTFRCKFNFEINGIDFFIERTATSDKKGNVKVNVEFWKIVDSKKVELNGEARRNTNDIIKDYIGEYNDFILTVLSIQNGKDGSFVDMGQTERKDLLSQFMGLNIYDKLNDSASKKYNEFTILLKNLNNIDYTVRLNTVENDINNLKVALQNETDLIEDILYERDKKNEELLELTKQLIPVTTSVIDITQSETLKIDIEHKITTEITMAENIKTQIAGHEKMVSELDVKLTELTSKDLIVNLENYNTKKASQSKLEIDIEKKISVIKNKQEKLIKLEEHKYDPNCDFCINNIFVKDALKTKDDIEHDKNETTLLMDTLKLSKKEISLLEWVVEDSKKYQGFKNDKTLTDSKISKSHNELLKLENGITQNKNKLSKLVEQITTFYEQIENIKNNTDVNSKISELKAGIKKLENDHKIKNNVLMGINTTLHTNINIKQQIMDSIVKVKELENSCECYKYYTQAINRDGIPYELIIQAIPTIQKEVNDILHQIVDFTVLLKTDGTNISTYLVYEDKSWILEMASGMEKFISSLAMRVALINISNLPRPNFIIFDEGWGTLDSQHLSEVKLLFDYLKTNFDFILVISHIDSIKDLVENTLEISKVDGFSHIKYPQ